MCLSEIISRPLIGQKSATSPGVVQSSKTRRSFRWMSSTKATYQLQQENKTNSERLSLAVPHSDLNLIGTSVRRSSGRRSGVAVRAVDCWQ